VAALGDENVGWLDVPVNNALYVGGVQSIGNLSHNFQDFLGVECWTGNAMLEGLSL
jgi:hypothetical protein